MDKHQWDRQAPRDIAAEKRVCRTEWFSERRVVWNLLNALIADGYYIASVDDGEGRVAVLNDPVKALDMIFAVDEARFNVRRASDGKSVGSVYIVLGNSAEEVVSDYGWRDDADGEAFEAWMDKFEPLEYLR